MYIFWKPIPLWDKYEASNNGQIRNAKSGKVLKKRILGQYYFVDLYQDGRKRLARIANLVAEAFLPNPANKPIVHHKDENKLNDKPGNLKWATYSENNKRLPV